MRSSPRAVADVNVLVSAARTPNGLCGRLLEAAIDGRWRPIVSMRLFEELEAVLARPKFRDVLGQEAADRFLAGLLAVAEWAPDPQGAPTAETRDPDDDYLSAEGNYSRISIREATIEGWTPSLPLLRRILKPPTAQGCRLVRASSAVAN